MNNLILLRHGQSQWNLENRFTGWKDVPLTEQGIEEAKIAGQLMKKNKILIDVIYSSILQRANKTDELAIKEMNLALLIDNNEPAIYNNLGYYKSKISLYKESIDDFNKAIELNNKHPFAYNNRGFSKLMLGDKSSINDIKISLRKESNNAVAIKNLALWEPKFGDKDKIPFLFGLK